MTTPAPTEQKALSVRLVDALNHLFGSHPGYRAVHAKGIVTEGAFSPAATAKGLSKAPHLQGGPVPVTARFSNFTGIPVIADGDPNASPRGLGLKFHLAGDAATDIVAHSYNGFPVSSGEEFVEFAQAIATTPPGSPPSPQLGAFLSSHPKAMEFAVAPKPTPASFSNESFYGVNAFRFTNAQGATSTGRYFILPVAGDARLKPEEAAAKPPHFLFEELAARLSRGPVEFKLWAQIAQAGDPTHDGSLTWPADRPMIELGLISITKTVADSEAAQRRLIFDPIRLADGIECSDDLLPKVRSEAYGVSYSRRNEKYRGD